MRCVGQYSGSNAKTETTEIWSWDVAVSTERSAEGKPEEQLGNVGEKMIFQGVVKLVVILTELWTLPIVT